MLEKDNLSERLDCCEAIARLHLSSSSTVVYENDVVEFNPITPADIKSLMTSALLLQDSVETDVDAKSRIEDILRKIL